MKPDNRRLAAEKMWIKAQDLIRQAPQTSMGFEFECQIQFMFAVLQIDFSPTNLSVAYHSALESEDLSWFLSRIEYELSKAS